jgi:hypothetical protein
MWLEIDDQLASCPDGPVRDGSAVARVRVERDDADLVDKEVCLVASSR